MEKGFGIAALVLAILSMFSPVGMNLAVIWVAMICAIVAALNGDRGLTIGAVVIAGAGLLLFAPVTLGSIANEARQGDYTMTIIGFGPIAGAAVALVIDTARRGKQEAAPIRDQHSGGGHDIRRDFGGGS